MEKVQFIFNSILFPPKKGLKKTSELCLSNFKAVVYQKKNLCLLSVSLISICQKVIEERYTNCGKNFLTAASLKVSKIYHDFLNS